MIVLLFETFAMTCLLYSSISLFQGQCFFSVRKLVLLNFLALSVIAIYLLYCFLQSHYLLNYVFEHSDISLPWYFKVAALWSGQEGSTLVFFILTQGILLIFLYSSTHSQQQYLQTQPYLLKLVLANVILMNTYCLSGKLLFLNLPFVPTAGSDLNPLLKDYAMTYHPPLLLAGQAGFFTISLLSLLPLSTDQISFQYLKIFTYATLSVLTMGITFGSMWAYHVLGWGGYWFWDPVENISLLPWLFGLALLHTRTKLGHLYFFIWPALLIGMLIVRSDSLISVHSFAQNVSNQGVFSLLIIVNLSYGIKVLFNRGFGSSQYFPSIKSVAAGSLAGIGFIIFFALTIPIIYSYLSDQSAHLGEEFYKKILPPILVSTFAYALTQKWGHKISIFATALSFYLFFGTHMTLAQSLLLGLLLALALANKVWNRHLFAHIITLVTLLLISLHAYYSYSFEILMPIGKIKKEGSIELALQEPYEVEGDFNTKKVIYPFVLSYHDIFQRKQTVQITPFQEIHPLQNMWTSKMYSLPGIFDEYCFMLGERTTSELIYLSVHYNPLVRLIWLTGLFISYYFALISFQSLLHHRKIRYTRENMNQQEHYAKQAFSS